jgi:hypothetical protein
MSPSLTRSLLAVGCIVAASGAGVVGSPAAEDAATSASSAQECIADLEFGYTDDAGKYFFTMNFQNNCDKPIMCSIEAYITSFRGPISAHAMLQFPARAQEPARKSYAVRVNAMTGTVQAGRTCNFL